MTKLEKRIARVKRALAKSRGGQDIPRQLRAAGITGKVTSGAFRSAFVAKDFVVKYQRDNYRRMSMESTLYREWQFISKMRKTVYKQNFPETIYLKVGRLAVLLQEKVLMRTQKMPKTFDRHIHVDNLAFKLGIDDMHQDNYGWRETYPGVFVPVFIDVDYRPKNGFIR